MTDISEIIGTKIRERRKYLGLSLENLSYSLNCSVQTVAKYEKASIRVPTPVLYEISKILKTDLNYFFSNNEEPPSPLAVKNIKDIQELNKHPINILFVEDNFADELLIRSATNDIEHKIFILRDADQLINYLNNHLPNVPFYIPDLIILDLRMKNISGVELLALIKRNQKTKHVPVIIYSNHCEVNVLKLCYQNGACGFINKSFNKADCIKSLQKTIDYWSNCVVLPRDNRA